MLQEKKEKNKTCSVLSEYLCQLQISLFSKQGINLNSNIQ